MQVLNTEAEQHTKTILSAAPIRFEARYVRQPDHRAQKLTNNPSSSISHAFDQAVREL